MLEVASDHGFTFDTVQMPLNVMDAHYRSFEHLVLPELGRQNIGVLGMKSLANGLILQSNTVTAIECLHYALNLPTSVVITGVDNLERLEQAFTAARTFCPMSGARCRRCWRKRRKRHRAASSSCSRRRRSSTALPRIRSGWARSPRECSR
jgi:aryl-alcohol dehydrogenase-like predicted oxidoreductase